MWNYEKRLQYPVNITQPNPQIAQIIMSQYGGPDGEMGASMRYLSQRYAMPNRQAMGMLTDIGTEGLLLHTSFSVSLFKSESLCKTKIHFCGIKFNLTSMRWSG